MAHLRENPSGADVRLEGAMTIGREDRGLGRVTILAAIVVSWLALRPYPGVVHDAQLYYHVARFGTNPHFAAKDLLVANDAQMSRSVFIPIVRPLVSLVGMGTAAMIAAAVGLASWIGASMALGRAVLGDRWWTLVIALPAFSAYWGPWFSIAESFSTPRQIAEAAVVGAVAGCLTNRWRVAVPLIAIAALVHPIIGLTGIGAVAVLWLIDHPRWTPWFGTAVLAVVLFCAVDPGSLISPRPFSAPWLHVVEVEASLTLPAGWAPIAWIRALFGFSILGAVIGTVRGPLRRLALSATVVGMVGLATSVLFSWVFVSTSMTQLQPWRSLWLVHVVAVVAVVWMSLEAWSKRDPAVVARALAAWALALLLVTTVPVIVYLIVSVCMVPLLIAPAIPQGHSIASWRLVRAMAAAVGALGIVQVVRGLQEIALSTSIAGIPWPRVIGSAFPATLLIALALIGVLVAGDRVRWVRVLVALALVGMSAAAIVGWDGRTDWQRFVEGLDAPVVELASDAVVLVEDDGMSSVQLLQRPSYFTAYAGAGVVFSERLADEYQQREDVVRVLYPQATEAAGGSVLSTYSKGSHTRADAARVCRMGEDLTHLFLRRPVTGLEPMMWISPVNIDPTSPDRRRSDLLPDAFALYACRDVVR